MREHCSRTWVAKLIGRIEGTECHIYQANDINDTSHTIAVDIRTFPRTVGIRIRKCRESAECHFDTFYDIDHVADDSIALRVMRAIAGTFANIAGSIFVCIFLKWIEVVRAVVAWIANVVGVGIGLPHIRNTRAVVALIPCPVAVGIRLQWIGNPGTIIDVGAGAIAVVVVERVIRTRIAGISSSILVGVDLRGIRHFEAIVACVPNSIAIDIRLRHVLDARAIVAYIADYVVVGILLLGIVCVGAIVTGVDDAVGIDVAGAASRTDIAGVTNAIPVRIFLSRIHGKNAIVARIAQQIAIGIQLALIGHTRTIVAGIAKGVAIGICLRGICDGRAVVDWIMNTVVVHIEYSDRNDTSCEGRSDQK